MLNETLSVIFKHRENISMDWKWDFSRGFFTSVKSTGRERIKKDNRFCVALFDIFFLYCYWTSVTWPDIWHTGNQFSLLLLVRLSWKVVCSHSFLICLDIVRIKYGFLSLSLLLGYYSCSTPVFWRSDMWLTDTKREDLDRLIKWTPWYSTSCNSQSQFSTATIKIALKSNSSLVDHYASK